MNSLVARRSSTDYVHSMHRNSDANLFLSKRKFEISEPCIKGDGEKNLCPFRCGLAFALSHCHNPSDTKAKASAQECENKLFNFRLNKSHKHKCQ